MMTLLRCVVVAVSLVTVLTSSVASNGTCSSLQSGSARISGMDSSHIGFVQVCKDEHWITISVDEEDEWTRKNSLVVCKELGFQGAIGILTSNGPPSQHGTALSSQQYYHVECTGVEQYLLDCVWSIKSMKSTKKDVMVMCRSDLSAGEVALVGINRKDSEGIVTLYDPLNTYNWSSICTTGWDDLEAQVVCKQLGFQGGSATTYSSEQELRARDLPMRRYSSFECSGSEAMLQNCTHHGPYPYQCNSHDYAGVICVLQEEDRTILDLNIALLAFMILISVMLVIILSLLLRCTLKRFRKQSLPHRNSHESEEGGASTCSPHNHITRTRLDHDMPYALLSTAIAPPSYADTILADQMVQQSDGLQHAGSTGSSPEPGDETEPSSSVNQLIVDETDIFSTDQHS